MDVRTLLLGGHSVTVLGSDAVRLMDRCEGFERFFTSKEQSEWTVSYGNRISPWSDGLTLSRFCFEEIKSSCVFSRKGDCYQFVMYPETDGMPLVCMQYRTGDTTVYASACTDMSAWRFSLWFACCLLGACEGLTFVHSSVAVYRGEAVLFLGESGTGKSTHTRLWLQHIAGSRILNDDSPLLSIETTGPVVYGSPWSGKTPCFHSKHFPLKALVRLSQAQRNAIRRLSVPEAFAAMQPSLPPALMQDNTLRSADGGVHTFLSDPLIHIISETISRVPVFHLQCLPDEAAARLCCSAVFGTDEPVSSSCKKELL